MNPFTSSSTIFYVENPLTSQDFYANLFMIEPKFTSETFVLFELLDGHKLGFWSKETAVPTPKNVSECMEFGLELPTRAAVDEYYETFNSNGTIIRQPPTELDFGYALTVLDPDGYRLRFYCLENQK